MLPPTIDCKQAFSVEFDWQICMENANSMNRTMTPDGLYWLYSGYMEVDVSTPNTVNQYMAVQQTQRLARAVTFVAPRTVTVDLTQSFVRVWCVRLE